MPGTTDEIYFTNFKVIPREIEGVRILHGIEANILDELGTIDVSQKLYHKLDYIIASLHSPTFKSLGKEMNTQTLLRVMDNPYVKIIGHPDDDRYPLDIEAIAKAASEKKVVLELNNGSLNPLSTRVNGKANIIKMLEACKKYDTMILMGTDAHICFEVGDFEASLQLLKEVNFPKELVINFELSRLNMVYNQ